jgi:DNA-binding transcriptional regulator YhcF (GntR family)
MPEIFIDRTSKIPQYRQIAEQLTRLIAENGYRSGFKIPSVRKLSHRLRVNAGTVAHAYLYLREQGIVVADRRRGTWVPGEFDSPQKVPLRRRLLEETVNELFLDTLSRGYSPDEIEDAFDVHLSRWKNRNANIRPVLVNLQHNLEGNKQLLFSTHLTYH